MRSESHSSWVGASTITGTLRAEGAQQHSSSGPRRRRLGFHRLARAGPVAERGRFATVTLTSGLGKPLNAFALGSGVAAVERLQHRRGRGDAPSPGQDEAQCDAACPGRARPSRHWGLDQLLDDVAVAEELDKEAQVMCGRPPPIIKVGQIAAQGGPPSMGPEQQPITQIAIAWPR